MALLNATTYGDVIDAVAAFLPQVMTSRPDVFKDLSGNPIVLPVDNTMEYSGLGSARPRIVLTEAAEQETNLPGDTENTHTLYPINVLIEDREAPTADSQKGIYLAWRKALMDAFRQRLLFIGNPQPPNTPTCQTDVKPRAVFNKGDEQYQFVRSHFLILVWVNEARVQP
jgi:hypothetical protein